MQTESKCSLYREGTPEVTRTATYLRVTATSDGVKDKKSLDRITKESQMRNNLVLQVRVGVSERRMPANINADVVQMIGTPIATYAIHLIPLTGEQIETEWKRL